MFKSIFFSIIGILLLCAMNAVMKEIITEKSLYVLPFFQLNILYLLFGILIQRKKVERILAQKSVQPNRLILPSLILIAIAIIPSPFWTTWIGHNPVLTIFFIHPLVYNDTHSIIGVFSGSLFIRSLS